jgi:hypothetical protein
MTYIQCFFYQSYVKFLLELYVGLINLLLKIKSWLGGCAFYKKSLNHNLQTISYLHKNPKFSIAVNSCWTESTRSSSFLHHILFRILSHRIENQFISLLFALVVYLNVLCLASTSASTTAKNQYAGHRWCC